MSARAPSPEPCRQLQRQEDAPRKGAEEPQCFTLCPSQPPSDLQRRDRSLRVPLGLPGTARVLQPGSWVHDGFGGLPAAPKPRALAARTQAAINQGKRKQCGTFLFFLIRITAASKYSRPGDEKAEKPGALSLGDRGKKSKSRPLPPLSLSQERGRGLHPLRSWAA